jgi:hypothetical protein
MGAHHKTGTSVIDPLAVAIASSFPGRAIYIDNPGEAGIHNKGWPNYTLVWQAFSTGKSNDSMALLTNTHAGTWPPADYPKLRCFLHLTRKPVDIVVSAYLYHSRLSKSYARCGGGYCEPWLYTPTSACNFLEGESLAEKFRLTHNETAGLLCQLECTRATVIQMQHMDREVRSRPDVGISMDLDEWHDSKTAVHKVFTFCGVEDMAERALHAYDSAYAKLSTSSHVNHDDELAGRLRAFLYQSGAADSLRY